METSFSIRFKVFGKQDIKLYNIFIISIDGTKLYLVPF